MPDNTSTDSTPSDQRTGAPADINSAVQHMHDQVASLIDQLSRIDTRGLAGAREELNAALQAHNEGQASGGDAGGQAGGAQASGSQASGGPDPRAGGQAPQGLRTSQPQAPGTGVTSAQNRSAAEDQKT